MNLQSEIEYFAELAVLDKARLLNSFLHELAQEARTTYGPGTEAVHDTLHLRFVNEISFRLTRLIELRLAFADPIGVCHVASHRGRVCRETSRTRWLGW